MSSRSHPDGAHTAPDAAPTAPGQGAGDPRSDEREPRRRRAGVVWAVVVVVAVTLAGAGYLSATWAGGHHEQSLAERQSEVAARGAQVMPFELDKTTHVLDEAADGGRQTVTADTARRRR